jgi:hypothetical protein
MKYFFHLEDGTCIRDPEGTHFQNDDAALLEATRVAHELSKLAVHRQDWTVVVKNADGIRVGSVPLTPSLQGSDDGGPPPDTPIH